MPRPRQYDDAVRTRLVEAASVAVGEAGPDGVSLRSVATAAQTTTAAVYALFGSRAALLDAVTAEGFRRFAAHLDAVEQTEDPAADLFRLGLAYRASALAEPHFYRALFGRAASPGHDTLAEPTFLTLQHALARLPDVGSEHEARERAIEVWAFVHGLVSLELGGHLPGDEQIRAERYAAALLRAR